MASVVHKAKLHGVDVHYLSYEGVQHTLEQLHNLFRESQTQIVSPIQSITFILVKVQDETLLSAPMNHIVAEDHFG